MTNVLFIRPEPFEFELDAFETGFDEFKNEFGALETFESEAMVGGIPEEDYLRWIQGSLNMYFEKTGRAKVKADGKDTADFRKAVEVFNKEAWGRSKNDKIDVTFQDALIKVNEANIVYLNWIRKQLDKLRYEHLTMAYGAHEKPTWAIKEFQADYDGKFGFALVNDGNVGAKTHLALLHAIKEIKSKPPHRRGRSPRARAPSPSSSKILATSPAPDRLYRIRKGDTLLLLAGKAYSVGAGGDRMRRAQLINRHPFNWRYHIAPSSSFNKQFFPEGIVTFMPRFSCIDADFNHPTQFPPKGRCFGIVFLPPDSDIWLRPPPEVVQPDPLTCWAAAILSWSAVAQGTMRFLDTNEVIDTFRALTIDIPTPEGKVRRRFVNASGGLVRWPKEDVVFERADGTQISVRAGQLTVETLAGELGVSFEIIDSALTIMDVIAILKKSDGTVIVLKTRSGEVGHAVVIFGGSERDNFVGEMSPLPAPGRPTGPALGTLGTRWLPTFRAFAEHPSHMGVEVPWDEFVFLFKPK